MYIKRIDNNNAVINISGNINNSHLFFNGKELTSIKSLSRGTVEFLIKNLNYSKSEINALLKNYRNFLLKLNNNSELLSAIFNTFSPFLDTGNYIVKTQKANDNFALYEYLDFDRSFYGGHQTLIALQKMGDLNRETVEKYKKEIKTNIFPYIVVLGLMDVDNDANYYFILDGHHKAMAYKELNMAPNIIFFEKIPDDNKEKIIYYRDYNYIYQENNAATLVECSLELNFDYKHKEFGTSSKRKIKLHPTEWSSGVVINKKESEIIQQEVDNFFLENNIFADVKKRLKEKSIIFRLKQYIHKIFKIYNT